MINATIYGRLGRVPDLHQAKTGDFFTTFSVASDHHQAQEKTTTWVDVLYWGQEEFITTYLRPGRRVVVSGELYMDQWPASTGRTGKSLAMKATHVQLVDWGSSDDADEEQAPAEVYQRPNDDIPF